MQLQIRLLGFETGEGPIHNKEFQVREVDAVNCTNCKSLDCHVVMSLDPHPTNRPLAVPDLATPLIV